MIRMDTMDMVAEVTNTTVWLMTILMIGMKNSELLVEERAALAQVGHKKLTLTFIRCQYYFEKV